MLHFSSTAAIFSEPRYIPIDEAHPKTPINAYGSSKLMVERALQDYDAAYQLKSVCLRYFNAANC
ncbi:MAG: NAD-dependent epimerase/dehydratase family protein [Thiotrichaceae bacterium]